MSKLITNTIRHTGGSADNITLDNSQNVTVEGNMTVDGTTTLTGAVTLPAGTTNDTLSFRNLVINGAMKVFQRGTASSDAGYQTMDRWAFYYTGHDEAPEQHEHSLTSSDTGPWAKGFRKSLYIRNGNQTSGAGADDYAFIRTRLEAQDIANSGWDYTSTSSYITLSFWVISSVAQNFFGHLVTSDGTQKQYPFETGSLSANTWTKITKTIPGHADLTFNNDNGTGIEIVIAPFFGTNLTANGASVNTWAAQSDSERMPDNTSTWWTTNDATFEITGVQLEVGDTASDFEHKRYSQELIDCQRYYFVAAKGQGSDNNGVPFCNGESHNGSQFYGFIKFPTEMRAIPTLKHNDGTDYYTCYGNGGGDACDTIGQARSQPNGFVVSVAGNLSLTQGTGSYARTSHDSALVAFDAEL